MHARASTAAPGRATSASADRAGSTQCTCEPSGGPVSWSARPSRWRGHRAAARPSRAAAATHAALGRKPDHEAHVTGWRHRTATPIKHLVVIFDENVSFDHYFGTYPKAANTDGRRSTPSAGTPKVNGLTPTLLTNNPNGVNPNPLRPAAAHAARA